MFSVVAQSDMLFHRSIKENIAFGAETSNNAVIKHAAELADASSFIEELAPDGRGFDVVVGEGRDFPVVNNNAFYSHAPSYKIGPFLFLTKPPPLSIPIVKA
ncbi:hypothetical protein [Brucella pituitosa]|uniref:hypothetical protein n=1 Tax=Brucella pituitosa TaxID=571256 RepID=UPI0013E3EA85|nr:hypothetical protein [Brucella pituitosa]